ncbi:MAG: hypothetical protein U0790_05390 [Isosphaeraceae bacterium]
MIPVKRSGYRAALVAFVSLGLSSLDPVAGQGTAAPARDATVLGAPDDAELLVAYQGDLSNQRLQSWEQYRGWVRTFYEGNLVSEGWSRFGEVSVSSVRAPETRRAVATQVNELGRIIGFEWAKDSGVRKITTTDLKRWNEIIAAAQRSDDGSGRRTIDALRAVREMAEGRSRGG